MGGGRGGFGKGDESTKNMLMHTVRVIYAMPTHTHSHSHTQSVVRIDIECGSVWVCVCVFWIESQHEKCVSTPFSCLECFACGY